MRVFPEAMTVETDFSGTPKRVAISLTAIWRRKWSERIIRSSSGNCAKASAKVRGAVIAPRLLAWAQ